MTENDNVNLEELKHSDPNNVDADNPRPYQDPENLDKLYHQLEWSQSDIADFYDVSQATISRAMDEAEVDARPPMDEREGRGIYRYQRDDGRTRFFIRDYGKHASDKTVTFYESNLVALQFAPLEKVFAEDVDVDHMMNTDFRINIPENLVVVHEDAHNIRHKAEKDEIPHETFFEWLGDPVDEEADSRPTLYIPVTPESTETLPTEEEPAGEPREAE